MATIQSFIKIGDGFSEPLTRFSNGLGKTSSSLSKLKNKISQNFKPHLPNGDFDRFDEKLEHTHSLFREMTGAGLATSGISHIVGGISGGVSSMIGELNESSKAWQTFNGNMEMLGMNSKQITSARKDMQNYAQATIYSSSDMAQTYSQLASVGVQSAGQLVKGFGGLASSATDPTQAMKTMSQQGTQMASKPMVQWQDFKLMLDQAPAGMAAVAKSMGKSNQQLVQDVQNGKLKTQDFFNAVEKTGNNKQFTKMATSYKTVGQAMDGLKETTANVLQPAFDKLGVVGINAISGLINKIGDLDLNRIADKMIPTFKKVTNGLTNLFVTATKAVTKFFQGFADTKAFDKVLNSFNGFKSAFTQTMNDIFGKSQDNLGGFNKIGQTTGDIVSTISGAFDGFFKAVKNADPNSIKVLAGALILLKASVKGMVITGLVLFFNWINKLKPGTIKLVASSIAYLASALALLFTVYKGFKAVKGLGSFFGKSKPKAPKTPQAPKTPKPSGNAGEWLKIGGALLLVGVAVIAIATGFYIMARASIQLANAGGGAIAVFFGMIVAIGALAVAVAVGGSAMTEGSVAFLIFGVAVLAIGAGIWLIEAGLTMLAGKLPVIAKYGLSASVAIVALSGAILAFGGASAVTGALLLVFAVGLTVASVAMVVATVACIALGAGALILGAGLMVVGIALELVGAGLSAVAGGVMDLYTTFVTIFGGISRSVRNTMKKVPKVIRTFLKKAKGFISNFSLAKAGRAVINGFVHGLKHAWEAGKKFVGGIASWIKKHKGPISYDRKLLVPHGNAVMTGFHEGLKNQFGNVKDSINGFTSDIGNTNMPDLTPGDAMANGFDRARIKLSALISSMKNLNGNNSIDVNGNGLTSDNLKGQVGYTSSSRNSTTNNSESHSIHIENGAIQITGSGNEEYDGEKLTNVIENYLKSVNERGLA